MSEWHREPSKRRAYEAGIEAKALSQSMSSHSGWGYPAGMYYFWFCLGYRGKPFDPLTPPDPYTPSRGVSQYAVDKVRRLVNAVGWGKSGILLAFARYIDTME